MNSFTIHTRSMGKITFSNPSGLVYCDFGDRERDGILGTRICEGGEFAGMPLAHAGRHRNGRIQRMNSVTFKTIREGAELDRQELADILLLSPKSGAKTVKEIEAGKTPVTGPVSVIMRLVQHGYLDAVIAASEAEDEENGQ